MSLTLAQFQALGFDEVNDFDKKLLRAERQIDVWTLGAYSRYKPDFNDFIVEDIQKALAILISNDNGSSASSTESLITSEGNIDIKLGSFSLKKTGATSNTSTGTTKVTAVKNNWEEQAINFLITSGLWYIVHEGL